MAAPHFGNVRRGALPILQSPGEATRDPSFGNSGMIEFILSGLCTFTHQVIILAEIQTMRSGFVRLCPYSCIAKSWIDLRKDKCQQDVCVQLLAYSGQMTALDFINTYSPPARILTLQTLDIPPLDLFKEMYLMAKYH